MQIPKKKSKILTVVARLRRLQYLLIVQGIAVGALAGCVSVAFRMVLEAADVLRSEAIARVTRAWWVAPVWLACLFGAAALVAFLLRYEPLISGSGIPQVKAELEGAVDQKWSRVLGAKFAGGVLTVGAGLSLGREGPSIQLGAMAGKGLARLTRRSAAETKLLMSCGAGAGLAAAFNAPFAGVLFVFEELHKKFSDKVLLCAMTATVTADFISRNIFGLAPVFSFNVEQMLPLNSYWLVLLLGAALGLFGVLYNYCIDRAQRLYQRIRCRMVRTLLPYGAVVLLCFVFPQVLGGGHALVEQLGAGGQSVWMLLVLVAVKFLFSVFCFASGVPGGIFLPLLVLGASVGAVGSAALQLAGASASMLPNFLILGMAGMFASVVRAPITGIILVSEMTGGFAHLLSLSLVSITAYVVADLMRGRPIYDQLLIRLLRTLGRSEPVNTITK